MRQPCACKIAFRGCQSSCVLCHTECYGRARHAPMTHLSADAKHHILLEYAPHSATHGFAALAARHAIAGGARTVQRWHKRWDHTVASLEEQPRTGRPRLLSTAQVRRHVRPPILAANRAHRVIHYPELLPRVQAATGSELSVRSLRRYGKEELGAKQKRSKKRTAAESECSAGREREQACLAAEHGG